MSFAYGSQEILNKDELSELLESAELGDPISQKELGDLYFIGSGLKKSFEKALFWYEKAALQGYLEVRRDIGVLYLTFHKKNINYIEAYKWFYLASLDEQPLAQKNLKYINDKLTASEIDQAKSNAKKWLIDNAKLGEPYSQYHLGKLFKHEGSTIEALKWIIIAEKYFSSFSGMFPDIDKDVKKELHLLMLQMTSGQIEMATDEAEKFTNK
ncbi:MAG: sel1 repeat family protein [Gammaproteobacteria bacterium]|nr:sel1 repeat family protein [Gammaproteobacteria bacterium]